VLPCNQLVTSLSTLIVWLTLETRTMRYGIAYLLGVPLSVLVVWYLISHLL